MTIKEVESAIRRAVLADDYITAPGYCRDAAIKLVDIAQQADHTPPHVATRFLAYPKAKPGEDVHYAIRVTSEEDDVTVNTVRAPGFPVYIGPTAAAPGLLRTMIQSEEVV